MGKYEELKELSEKQFRRLTGVERGTFEKMVTILLEAQQKIYRRAGRKGNLNIKDKLLMALEYLREYRTYFHLCRSYGLSESACFRACRWVEDALIKNGEFSLPGKKDASESTIELPKKSQKEEKDNIVD